MVVGGGAVRGRRRGVEALLLAVCVAAAAACASARAIERVAGPSQVRVRVVDARGEAVRGATLWIPRRAGSERSRASTADPLPGSPFAELRRLSLEATTGRDGMVDVVIPHGCPGVVAHDARRGEAAALRLGGGIGDTLQVALAPVHDAVVEVVGDDGAPLAGVVLQLGSSGRLTTDERGRATITALDRLADDLLAWPSRSSLELAGWLSYDAPRFELPPLEVASAAPHRLVVPPCTRVDFELRDATGALEAVDGWIEIERVRVRWKDTVPWEDRESRHGLEVRGGKACWWPARPRAAFRARAIAGARAWECEHLGARDPGEVATIALRPADPPPLMLRLTDAAGRPLARARFVARLCTDAGWHWPLSGITDERGAWTLGALPSGTRRLQWVELFLDEGAHETALGVVLTEAELAAAGAGPLVRAVAPMRVVAYGRVVDERGVPVEGASVVARGESEVPIHPFATHTDADGRFEVRGFAPAGKPLRLVVEEARFSGAAMVEATVGADDLAIELARRGHVAGRILLPDGVPTERVRVRVDPTDVDWTGTTYYHGLTGGTEDDGSFAIPGLPAGRYDLDVAICDLIDPQEDDHVARIEGVVVEAGAVTRDARLAALDLRGAVQVTRLQLRAAGGGELEEGEVSREGEVIAHGAEQLSRGVVLAWRGEPPRVVVRAPKHRAQEVVLAPGVNVVELQRGFERNVLVAPGGPLAEAPLRMHFHSYPRRLPLADGGWIDADEWEELHESTMHESVDVEHLGRAAASGCVDAGFPIAAGEEHRLVATAPMEVGLEICIAVVEPGFEPEPQEVPEDDGPVFWTPHDRLLALERTLTVGTDATVDATTFVVTLTPEEIAELEIVWHAWLEQWRAENSDGSEGDDDRNDGGVDDSHQRR